MDLLNSPVTQTPDTVPARQDLGISTATSPLSGFYMTLGVPPAMPPASERADQPQLLEFLIRRSNVESPRVLIPGRVTGPVRMILRIAHAWSLNDNELASLLAYPSSQFAADLRSGKLAFAGNEDRADRLRLMYSVHSTLAGIFIDEGDEEHWMRTANALLNNNDPLSVMMRDRIPGMLAVREIVERNLANR